MEDNDGFLTFDDILIVPNYSDIESRHTIDTGVSFLGTDLAVPIISANMDFVTGPEMVKAMYHSGGLGILHRFWESDEAYLKAIKTIADSNIPVWYSVGVRNTSETLEFIKKTLQYGYIEGICVDVAHGHHAKVGRLVEAIKSNFDPAIARAKVIAGNVATYEGVEFLYNAGADAIKVGIGAGSACTTREVAGVGIPQWTAILECSLMKEGRDLTIIADGGIRSSGDIAKALAAGADVVMVGNLLAGTDEAPGDLVQNTEDSLYKYKRYRGQASFGSNGERYVKEGIEGLVPYKGPVEPVIQQLRAGLQSSMSYVGASTIREFMSKAKVVKVSSHTLMENNTRILEYVYGRSSSMEK